MFYRDFRGVACGVTIFSNLYAASRGLIGIGLVSLLLSCASGSSQNSVTAAQILQSNGHRIDQSLLEPYKRYINADPLENRVYFSGSDYDDFLLGTTYRLITFRYDPSDKHIVADFRSMTTDWIFSEYVSVYVGKEKLVDKSSGFSRYTDTSIVDAGNMGSSVYTHETYSLILSLDAAKKIANADKSSVTVRFGGGRAGYVDSNPHPLASMKGLRSVVSLADYFSFAGRESGVTTSGPEGPQKTGHLDLRVSDRDSEKNENKSAAHKSSNEGFDQKRDSELSETERELASGSILLLEPTIFKGYGAAMEAAGLYPKMKILYQESLWIRLVETIKEHNFGDNLAYYYLGRAAYELGHSDAALKYLNKSIRESGRRLTGKCIACNGIKLPAEAELLRATIGGAN